MNRTRRDVRRGIPSPVMISVRVDAVSALRYLDVVRNCTPLLASRTCWPNAASVDFSYRPGKSWALSTGLGALRSASRAWSLRVVPQVRGELVWIRVRS